MRTDPALPGELTSPVDPADLAALSGWLHRRSVAGGHNGDHPRDGGQAADELGSWLTLREPVRSGLRCAARLLACVHAGVRRDGRPERPDALAERVAGHLDLPAQAAPLGRDLVHLVAGALTPTAAGDLLAVLEMDEDSPEALDAVAAVLRVTADYTTGCFRMGGLTPGHVLDQVGTAEVFG